MLSQKIIDLPASATMEMSQRARDLQAKGADVISLAAGEPDFDTPDHVKDAAKNAIDAGHTKYTAVDGITELKQAVCEKFARDNALSYSPRQINVSPGGKAVLFNALAASLNPGDEVIIPAPCWVSYPDMVTLLDGKPVILPTHASNEFKISADQLRSAITDKTRWLMLNSPSNPTGAVYTREELRQIGDALADYPHVMILTDEIYEHLVYNGEFVSFAQANPELFDRTLTMNGVSKAYAMTGWRIGFAGGPESLIRGMAKVMGQSTSNPCSISQWAAITALTGDQGFLADRLAKFQERRDYVVSALSNIPGLSCDTPSGAFYVFAGAENCLGKISGGGTKLDSDIDLSMAILNEAQVAVVPGTAFHAQGHIRLSYATDMNSLRAAIDRLGDFFSRLT